MFGGMVPKMQSDFNPQIALARKLFPHCTNPATVTKLVQMITRLSNHHHLPGFRPENFRAARAGHSPAIPAVAAVTGDTNAPTRLIPGPGDGRIAYVAARLLEEYHYSQHPLDREMSGKFFDGYLRHAYPQHLYFLKPDIAEFDHYGTNLDPDHQQPRHGRSDARLARFSSAFWNA